MRVEIYSSLTDVYHVGVWPLLAMNYQLNPQCTTFTCRWTSWYIVALSKEFPQRWLNRCQVNISVFSSGPVFFLKLKFVATSCPLVGKDFTSVRKDWSARADSVCALTLPDRRGREKFHTAGFRDFYQNVAQALSVSLMVIRMWIRE